MSDSFADLWNQTAPSKPSPPPPKLGTSPSSNGHAPYRKTNDVFAMLASTPSSSSNSRSITPSYAPASIKPSVSGSSAPMNARPTAPQLTKPTHSLGAPGGGDAFSSLLSGSMAGSDSANMTIAQRAAMVETQRRDDAMRKMEASRKQSEAWAGLDSLGSGRKALAQQSSTELDDDDWGFGASNSSSTSKAPPAKTTSPPTIEEDDWGLGDFVSAPSSNSVSSSKKPSSQSNNASSSQSQSIWDLDEFASPSTSAPAKPKSAPRSDTNSPALDFDFGDREDGLLDEGDDDDESAYGANNKYRRNDDEDDILGMLSKPVVSAAKRRSPLAQSSQAPPVSNGKAARPISPPPHILGQLVEMGFMPQDARAALAATQNEDGLDVQAAAEMLLNGAGGSESSVSGRRQERDGPPEEPRRRARPPINRAASSSGPERPSPARPPGDGALPVPLQEHADKFIAQASTLGLSVFNRANTLWAQGKEKAKVLYEERAAAAAAASGGGAATKRPMDGRPKWMQDQDGFKDDDDEVAPPSQPAPGPSRQKSAPAVPSQATKPQEPQVKTGDLFSDEAPKAYVSPFRRGKPTPASSPSAPAASGSKSAPPKTGPKPASVPKPRAATPPLATRNAIAAPPASLAASLKHKTIGTEKYKLGQFGDAEAAYSQAISALPSGHLLLVPLYNNRALARIKTGNMTGAVDDCTAVVEIIGTDYHPSREKKVEREDCGSSVDLGDALVKAFRRRAEAWEGREKWEEAAKDWGVVVGTGWAASAAKNEALRGAGRCRKMVSAPAEGSGASAPPVRAKPRPAAKPTRPPARSAAPSQALSNLKEARSAQEAEDQERADLKDKVDARLTAWKGGKESNIRALLASLETVLWPGLGWQKVSMAEVISPSQVKIRYTKAIAKLHPDKVRLCRSLSVVLFRFYFQLNSNNTTVEERMIANGVFGALNDAWNAFKQ
ncbi:hypothetical protein HWV62_9191 [Athelia sp. TMB]|nr:hypothetical protein HWV62_9191 [Athelia sp. TMB]